MTTPHPEEPAEGPVEVPDEVSPGDDGAGQPSSPDRTGASIDSGNEPADLS